MSTETVETSIRESLSVDAPRERAFSVFTEVLDSWFPREYNLLAVDIAERTFEPREGGRIFDRGTDGSECSWGKVLAYEPPERVVFAWAIDRFTRRHVFPGRVERGIQFLRIQLQANLVGHECVMVAYSLR